MGNKVNLKIMRCPTCGASLKAENSTDLITCVYCGNTIAPVAESSSVPQNGTVGNYGGVLRIEGIKTSSSALAYMELFFEEYDWEAFAYEQTISVAEMDEMAHSLKASLADEKNTWVVNFKAISVPYIRKISGCNQILDSVIEEYKKDSLEAYSKFDAYKTVAAMIALQKSRVIADLEKISANAGKYGATPAEVATLNVEIDCIRNHSIKEYSDIEDIPEIKAFIHAKDIQITEKLAAKGIQVEEMYRNAKELIAEQRYVEALNILKSLEGYSDTNELIEKIDKYYLISDVLEIEGNLYYFKKNESGTMNLYPSADGRVSENAIIKNVSKMITNYADILYYLNGEEELMRCDLSAQAQGPVSKKKIERAFIYVYDGKLFVLGKERDVYTQKHELLEVRLSDGTVKTIRENVEEIIYREENRLAYTVSYKDENEREALLTNIIDVDTGNVVGLGRKKVEIEGFVGKYVVYTQQSPNDYNKRLYIKGLSSQDPEELVEQNIFKFCAIIADKLFYYVGNSTDKVLVNINCDGTERKEWPRYISEVLFEQGGWVYFIRRAGYNAILCKARPDGSQYRVIAADIEKFVEIKNGYLYYINYESALVKVRMDGSNLQRLCDNVESVLSVKEDKILFVSIDDSVGGEFGQGPQKKIKSIYAVEFFGSGKIKLAYDVKEAKEYDENTVYYIATERIEMAYETDKKIDVLYKLDVGSNNVEKLIDLEMKQTDSGMSGFEIAMIIMAIVIVIGLIGFGVGAPGLGVFCLVVAPLFLMVGWYLKEKTK